MNMDKIGRGIATLVLIFVILAQSKDIHAESFQGYILKEIAMTNAKQVEFKDVKQTGGDAWAYESILWGVRKDIIKGYTDGTFKPREQITEAEFLTVLSRYVKLDLGETEKGHWANHIYKTISKYNLPIKGNNNDRAKDTALTRGEIARIIAAKNGFNLDERQAVYYMYENDISNGLVANTLSFESYGTDKAVQRQQIPAFFQRLESKGHTTFMGKPSKVNPDGISGIGNIPKENTVITDEMFKELEDKQLGNPKFNVDSSNKIIPNYGGPVTEFQKKAAKMVEGRGYIIDALVGYEGTESENDFSLRDADAERMVMYQGSYKEDFDITVHNYNKNKELALEVMRLTGKLTEEEIQTIVKIIEVDHIKNNYTPQHHVIGDGNGFEPSGNLTDKIKLRIGIK